MTVSVTLTFPNYEAALLSLAKLNVPLPAPQPAEPAINATEVRERVAEQPVVEADLPGPAGTKRRGRPSRKDIGTTAVIPESPTEVVPASAPAAAKDPSLATMAQAVIDSHAVIKKEQALAKFQELHAAKGIAVCRSVLARCGAERFAMVKSEQYPEFVKLCDRALAGEDLTLASE